ncbi:hypothetical protein UA70_02475, partial [Raoultella planticola]
MKKKKMAAAARFDKSGLRQLSRNPGWRKCAPGQHYVAGAPSALTHYAFAQAGFQPGVLINHILL